MVDQKRGGEVVAQSRDGSLTNTEPVMVRNAVVGIVSAVLSILVMGGYIYPGERTGIEEQVGIIVPAVLVLAQIISGVWSRMGAYSPRSAAKIAVANAAKPAGAVPAMDPPP